MRYLFLLGLFCVLFSMQKLMIAQNHYNLFQIKNYKYSNLLSISGSDNQKVLLSDFGEVRSLSQNRDDVRYFAESQEYLVEFGIYLFPKRIFECKSKRFIQPDGISQFDSPYLFQGADPINRVDFDGNVSKPIVFYREDPDGTNKLRPELRDFKYQVPDAYYVPMSDFVNGKAIDVPEWNGNVYIDAHMGPEAGREIVFERSAKKEFLKTNSPIARTGFNENVEAFESRIDAKKFGRALRLFSDEKRVPVKNIVAAGCEGSTAAERIGEGFTRGKALSGNILNTYGLEEGKVSLTEGRMKALSKRKITKVDDFLDTRYYVGDKDMTFHGFTKRNVVGEKVYSGLVGKTEDGALRDLEYAHGRELNEFVNGRIPERVRPFYKSFRFEY